MFVGGFDRFDDKLWRRIAECSEDAARVQPANADDEVFDDLLEFIRLFEKTIKEKEGAFHARVAIDGIAHPRDLE